MPVVKVKRYSLGSSKNNIEAGLTAVPVSDKIPQYGSVAYTQSRSDKKSQT